MNTLTRRSFLKKSLLAGASAGLGMGFPAIVRADGWGELPSGIWAADFEGFKVLEIFCYSGMSQWENFWVAEDMLGNVDWSNFATQVTNMDWHCPNSPSPAADTEEFGMDSQGNTIHWGPATKPLWRSDIFSKCRMVTVGHDLLPHEAATPLALTGRVLGNPRLAGLGAAIEHRAMDVNPRDVPYSVVLSHDDLGIFQFIESSMIASGMHPGQPLLLRIGDSTFQNMLQRNDMSDEADQLITIYNEMYRDRLRWLGMGDQVRSAGYRAFDTATKTLLNAENLDALLGGSILAVNNGPICATYPLSITSPSAITPTTPLANKTATALDVAVHLLTTGDMKYACVVDRGILPNGAANSPYDTHTNQRHAETNATNLFNLLTQLASQIDAAETDATKLHLSNTLIVINTEFGRTPAIEVAGSTDLAAGRNHHPYGYVSTLIGGPVTTRGIAGGMTAGTPPAGSDFSPTDVHGAVMLAAGIDPFASENFGVTDFTTNVHDGTEPGTRLGLKTAILGA